MIVCGSVTDASGRIVSSQTVSAFWHSVRHAKPLAVGLNGALGATLMRPYIEALTCVAGSTFVSCYPNAGLPAIAQKVGTHRPRCGHSGAWFGALAPEAT